MKLDKLTAALAHVRKWFGLDMTDLLILNEIVQAKKTKKQVTIMELSLIHI